jgi:DNA-binding XRE family transcriptional regulator
VEDAGVDVTTPVDVGRHLRRLRAAVGETQAQSAEAVGVSRANLAQWEAGRYLPSESSARLLDDHFNAGNVLVNLAAAARTPHGRGASAITSAKTLDTSTSLLDVFHQVGRSLADHLIRDDRGNPIGWRHNLQKDQHQTALSTAYGIKAMLVVGEPYVDFDAIAANLFAMQAPEGGWRGRSGASRPEITAAVVDALFRIGTPMSVQTALTLTEQSLDPFSRTRPYLLSTVSQTVSRLRPDSALAVGLIDDLLATRLSFDGTLLWPEKVEHGLALPEPSAVHTARALVALREAQIVHDRDDIQEAVEQATQWLIARTKPDDGVTEELIRSRPDGHGSLRVAIRHFTSAWVVQALAGATSAVPISRLTSAFQVLWSRFDRNLGLWAWGNGDLPIWMTLDSVTALSTAALALAGPPLSPPGD